MSTLKFVLATFFSCAAAITNAQVQIVGTAAVIDGDTLDMSGVRIRLFGADAPESAQNCTRSNGTSWSCGTAARSALAEKLGGSPISCERRDVDNYGRVVAVCTLGDEDINAWLVASGWAVAYRRYSDDYLQEESTAKLERLNIWSGALQLPEEFRIEQDNASRSARSDCKIKGNISTNGNRIYHVPGGEFYEQTVISPSRDERMFCSEQEARDAGWRRSKR